MKYLNSSTSDILLATDFSQTSQRAFDAAVRMARAFGAKLHLLHVNEEDEVFEGHDSQEIATFLETIAKRRAEWMTRFEEAAKEAGIEAEAILRGGDPADTILEEAERINAGIIAMGTQGSHGLGNMLPGSVARKVLRSSKRPVLIVSRVAGVAPLGSGGTFENVVYPTDFSPASRAGLEACNILLDKTGAKLTLINVLRMPRVIPVLPGEAMIAVPVKAVDHLTEKLERQMKELQEHVGRDRVDTEIGVNADPADAIAEMSAHGGVDLIVMPRHSKHGLGAFFFGSTAERLVKVAPVPVLVFNPTAE